MTGGLILFTVENLEGANVGGISLHSCDEKNGVFSFGIAVHQQHRGQDYAEEGVSEGKTGMLKVTNLALEDVRVFEYAV